MLLGGIAGLGNPLRSGGQPAPRKRAFPPPGRVFRRRSAPPRRKNARSGGAAAREAGATSNCLPGGAGRAFMPGIFRRPGGADSRGNTRSGDVAAWGPPKRAFRRRVGASSPRAQATRRSLGDERLPRNLRDSTSHPISHSRRVIDNAGRGHGPDRRGRSPTGRWPHVRGPRWEPRKWPRFRPSYIVSTTPIFRLAKFRTSLANLSPRVDNPSTMGAFGLRKELFAFLLRIEFLKIGSLST